MSPNPNRSNILSLDAKTILNVFTDFSKLRSFKVLKKDLLKEHLIRYFVHLIIDSLSLPSEKAVYTLFFISITCLHKVITKPLYDELMKLASEHSLSSIPYLKAKRNTSGAVVVDSRSYVKSLGLIDHFPKIEKKIKEAAERIKDCVTFYSLADKLVRHIFLSCNNSMTCVNKTIAFSHNAFLQDHAVSKLDDEMSDLIDEFDNCSI